MERILGYTEFISERHHMLSGGDDLGALSDDIARFVRYQMTHSTGKKKMHDPKKSVLYYRWDFPEIAGWFAEEGAEFHYPSFMAEAGATVSVKISVGRLVKGRRNEYAQDEILRTKGNERASHASKIIDRETGARNHVVYLNAYYLAREKNMEVLDFIKSDSFGKELDGTVRHEFMHAYDTYKISPGRRSAIDAMKKAYKAYRAKHGVGKEYLKMDVYGKWDGGGFRVDKEFVNSGDELKTFYFLLLYYLTETEMHSYLQTFWNQMMQAGDAKDGLSSDIYRRYRAMKAVLGFDGVEDATAARAMDEEFVSGISLFGGRVKSVLRGLGSTSAPEVYDELRGALLRVVDGYLKKMNKILYDISEIRKEQ